MSGETIGIIYPPPELRNIVDKTAGFVANSKNGPEFEARIQQNEKNNPKFNFLNPGDPYHAYYRNKVRDFQEAREKGEPIPIGTTTTSSSVTAQQKSAKQLEQLAEPPLIVKGPPAPFEFSAEPPTLQAMELDIVKLTAQFVAIHGRSFLTSLMQRESKNYQFDFIRPQHGLFSYFTQLIEQYTKILVPPKDIVESLRNDVSRDKNIMDKIRHRLEWTKIQEAERRKEEEEAERERVQYAQIDWHDFVLVESVDYQPTETGMFPPPTTPEQVGSRILLQQRIEEQGAAEIDEMDVESDEEDENEKDSSKEAMPPPPLPPSLDNVVIRKDYNPRAKNQGNAPTLATSASAKSDAWVISPITGQKIPAEKLQEHMRYGLLDPRWVEERERSINEKMQQEEVFAHGVSIDSSLKQLAERRTDIFGSGAEETAIGRKIGEEEKDKRQKDKVIWDGFSSSAQSAITAAQSRITIEEQIEDIKKRMYPDPEKEKIGPAVIPPSAQPKLHPQSQQNRQPPPPSIQQQKHPHHQGLPPPIPQSVLLPSTQTPFILPTPQLNIPMGMYGMHGLPPPDPSLMHGILGAAFPTPPLASTGIAPPNPIPISTTALEDSSNEPPSKKLKTEESLISEEDFLKQSPPVVNILISVPAVSEKSDWKLNGQTLNFSLDIKETFSAIKTRIQESTGLPPGKQKLQYEGMFVKDTNSLAFYNITNGSSIILQLKERGGRKK